MQKIIANGVLIAALTLFASDAKCFGHSTNMILPSADTVENVEVYISPDGLKTVIPMTEEGMQKHRCYFESSQPRKINDLLSIINDYSEKSELEKGIKLRHLIYLNFKDGTKAKIVMSDNRNTEHFVLANYVGGPNKHDHRFKLRDGFLKSLRAWASSEVRTNNHSPHCLETLN